MTSGSSTPAKCINGDEDETQMGFVRWLVKAESVQRLRILNTQTGEYILWSFCVVDKGQMKFESSKNKYKKADFVGAHKQPFLKCFLVFDNDTGQHKNLCLIEY